MIDYIIHPQGGIKGIMGQSSSNQAGTYLTGRILLAMPAMGDPRFHRAVIYMCAHDENGAMGLVINHTLPGVDLGKLLKQLDIPAAQDTAPATPVMSGGPVETARGFVLHSSEFNQNDTIRIDDMFSVTGTLDALKAIAGGQGPDKMLFVLGYAGWSPGQLDREIQDNAWLVADADPGLIFDSAPESKWEQGIKKLGFDPGMLSGEAGRA